MKSFLTFILLLVGSLVVLNAQSIIYVKHDAAGANDGSSWMDAYTDLQPAINAASDNDQIWVAAGVYLPTLDNPFSTDNTSRDRSFYINKSVMLYGGFIGTETTLGQRDWANNETTLSGDLGANGIDTDNALHVVFFDARSTPFNLLFGAGVDGFTITKGNANKTSFMSARGGGVFNNGELGSICSSIIINCKLEENKATSGGAIFNAGYDGQSSPTISNCMFINNVATENGGAIFNDGTEGQSSPRIENSTFTNNNSIKGGAIFNDGAFNGIIRSTIYKCHFSGNTAHDGGAIYNGSTFPSGLVEPIISACWFSNNSATNSGGAMCFLNNDNGDMKATIVNCIFENNGAEHISYDDGQANEQPHFINCTFYGATTQVINVIDFTDGGTPVDFTNCIFWGNNNNIVNGNLSDNSKVNIRYSIVEEAAFMPGDNNKNEAPIFVDAANGDFHLDMDSPAFDVGENAALPSGVSLDIEDNPRIENSIVNLGAYEGETMTSALSISYFNFNGKALTQSNLLEWSISNEKNTKTHFIQRSRDGVHFETIGELAPNALQLTRSYQWEDKQPLSQSYYRIATIDNTGKQHLSHSIFLNRELATKLEILSLYPNPIQSTTILNFNASKTAILQIRISDEVGKVVYEQKIKSNRGQNEIRLDISHLSAGVYWLQMLDLDGSFLIEKLLVQK